MTTKSHIPSNNRQTYLPKILILISIILLIVVVVMVKSKSPETTESTEGSPAAQLAGYMKEGKPVFAFYHSTTCHTCIVMMETVAQVYPEFKDDVALVDVNVYDPQNENLLQQVGITVIPTLVFIDSEGNSNKLVGGLDQDQLRKQLTAIMGTP